MIARSNRTPTPSREALRDVCGESTGASPPRGLALDALDAPHPGEPIRNRPKLPLVDEPAGKSRSFDVSCAEVEPEPLPMTAYHSGSACTHQPPGAVPEGRRLITGRDATIGEIFRRFGGQYLLRHRHLQGTLRSQVLKELTLCRTEALGWSDWECEECACTHRTCNPCRNRHCPQCLGHVRRQWLARHQQDLLDLPYYHLVLTTPHQINVLVDDRRNLRAVYYALFWATRDALLDAVRYDSSILAEAGMLVVLHSWSQLLNLHLHMHILLPAAGWSLGDRNQLVTTDDAQWLPIEDVMRLFCGKLIRELTKARNRGKCEYPGEHSKPKLHMTGRASHLADDAKWKRWTKRLERLEWVGDSGAPELPAETTLEYLGRYAQKAAIGNSRIQEIDVNERSVTFSYRNNRGADHHWGSIEEETIDAMDFIDRFLLHVMPARMTRVRKFGWWSGTKKAKEIPRIRKALGMPEVNVETCEEPSEHDKFDGNADAEREEEILRVICRACKTRSMVRVAHYPKPSIGRIRKWNVWPELEPRGDQMVLPSVEPYLPGGSHYYEAMGFT